MGECVYKGVKGTVYYSVNAKISVGTTYKGNFIYDILVLVLRLLVTF